MEDNNHDSGKDIVDLNNIQPGVVDSREHVTTPTALGTEQNDWVNIATDTLNENTSEQSNQVEKEEADGLDSSGKGTEIEEVDGDHDYNPITNTAYTDFSTATTSLQNHYDKLIHLPVRTLLPSLFASEVVTSDQKQRVDDISLDTEKMGCILHLIMESLKTGVAIKYNKFLEVMKNSEDVVANEIIKSLAPPILTTTELPQDSADVAVINHYKELYSSSTRFCDDDNYALGHIREYIDLVFMLYKAKKTEQHLRYATKLRHGGNIDEAACKAHFSNISKEKKLSRIFELTNPFIFIFEGAPGIGKSMVARQIAYEWANGEILHNIELLLLLKFRDPKLHKVQNFCELMQHCNAYTCKEYFSKKQGRNLLLVFDGYDELSPETNIYSLFKQLLSRKILPCCSIVFTSRSYNTGRLHQHCNCRIEIMGFSENDRFNFLTKNNVSHEETDKVRRFLQNNLIINSLCYIPFNMESLLLLVLEEKDLPKTQTQLLKESINVTISHHIKKSSKYKNISDQGLEIETRRIVNLLAPFAFRMIANEKIVFTESDINNSGFKITDKNAFGMIQTAQFTNITTSTEPLLYSFVHFSVQEYLAAHHLSQRFSIAQSFHLHHNFWDERYFAIWKMYVGITEGKEFALQHFLSGENYIIGGFRYLTGKEFPGVSEKIMLKKVNCLLLYQMFLEAPGNKLKDSLSDVVKNDTIDLSNEKLYLEDISIVTYCIARSYITMNWKLIDLCNCQIGDEECSKIFQGLSLDDGRQKPVIQCLDLSNNDITFENSSLRTLPTICSTVIHRLNISGNSITTFKAFDSLLKGSKVTDLIICHNKQQITDLQILQNTHTIEDLNLSYNNWPTVKWSLPNLPSLRKLDMSHCKFNEDDSLTLHVISNIPFPSLQELKLTHCYLSDDASAILLNAIPKTVRLLDLSHNQINDRALASLQELFTNNSQLLKLYLVSTELNGTSALSCAEALRGCRRLQTLDISGNDMSDDEAELVIRMCHNISSLKELKLKDITLTDNMLRHASEFSITNYRNPIKRNILVIGMKNTGKTTLIRKLIKGSCHDTTSNNINPLWNTTHILSTAKVVKVTEVLFINGKFYECTFIDTPGLTEKFISASDDISNELDKVNLILFVFKHGQPVTTVLSILSDHFKDMRCLSASVITYCDELTKSNYEGIIREFTSDPITKQFSTDHDIGGRVYPIGFPSTTRMEAIADEINSKFIQKNISKLLQLIEICSDHTPTPAGVKEATGKRCSVM